jgi:hypothetical protein
MSRTILLATLLALPIVACQSSNKVEPQVASSAKESNHAETFPDELDSAGSDFKSQQEAARKIFSAYFEYPKKLKDPKGVWVQQIYEKADAAGKSEAYVERMHKVEGVAAFFDVEKDAISQKVAGSANYANKQKKCDVDVGPSVSSSLKSVVEDRLEKRLRERNEAHVIIERYKDTIPKEDVPILEDQADDIAYASYVVNIELVEDKVKIRKLLSEAEQIPKTADEYIAQEKAFQAEAGRTDAEKKASDARIADMQKQKDMVAQAVGRAKDLDADVEKQLSGVQKEYAEAFKQLKDQLKQ